MHIDLKTAFGVVIVALLVANVLYLNKVSQAVGSVDGDLKVQTFVMTHAQSAPTE